MAKNKGNKQYNQENSMEQRTDRNQLQGKGSKKKTK